MELSMFFTIPTITTDEHELAFMSDSLSLDLFTHLLWHNQNPEILNAYDRGVMIGFSMFTIKLDLGTDRFSIGSKPR
jgi:hypothetical protein